MQKKISKPREMQAVQKKLIFKYSHCRRPSLMQESKKIHKINSYITKKMTNFAHSN